MVKKLLPFALAAVLTLALVGCGTAPSVPAPPAGATITGTVIDATMSTTTIKTDDGKELLFATADAKTEMKDGLLLGDVVTVTYEGELKEGDATGVTVLALTDGADNSQNPLRTASSAPSGPPEAASNPDESASSGAADEQLITGAVTAVGMSAITIKTSDDRELSFLMEGAENLLTTGPQEGQQVTLVYTGELTNEDASAATLLRIEPVAE